MCFNRLRFVVSMFYPDTDKHDIISRHFLVSFLTVSLSCSFLLTMIMFSVIMMASRVSLPL